MLLYTISNFVHQFLFGINIDEMFIFYSYHMNINSNCIKSISIILDKNIHICQYAIQIFYSGLVWWIQLIRTYLRLKIRVACVWNF